MKVLLVVLLIGALILSVTGWIKNIVKLSECDFVAPYNAEVIRVVGIIPPVGAVLGWLEIEDISASKK